MLRQLTCRLLTAVNFAEGCPLEVADQASWRLHGATRGRGLCHSHISQLISVQAPLDVVLIVRNFAESSLETIVAQGHTIVLLSECGVVRQEKIGGDLWPGHHADSRLIHHL